MKFAIVGVGGVGGYFGGRLAQAGHEVTLVARGENLQAIQQHGLRIFSPDGDAHITDISATDVPADAGHVDVVIVAVKGWQLEAALPNIKPLVGPHTIVLPLLNGVEAAATLSTALDPEYVINGLCGIIAKLDGPACIRHLGIKPFVKFGESDSAKSDRVKQLADAFSQTGITAEIPEDINRAIWQKFMFIAPLSGMTAITRTTSDIMRSIPESRKLLEAAVGETVGVGAAMGIDIGDKDIQSTLEAIDKVPQGGSTSMQRDIESGFRSELETQTGAVVRFGKEQKIPTPVNEFIYAALLPQEMLAISRRTQ